MTVGVVILTSRGVSSVEAAYASLPRDGARVLVVVNGAEMILRPEWKTAWLHLPRNLGYGAGMNAGARALFGSGCDCVLLCNDDVTINTGTLERLAEALADPQRAAVGPVIVSGDSDCLESCGAAFDARSGRYRMLSHGDRYQDSAGIVTVECLSGAAWMIGRQAWQDVGPLDESYFYSFEETDWCGRARRAGYSLAVVREAVASHRGSATLGLGNPERFFYAARNHLRAVEKLAPLRGLPRAWRQARVIALNLAHALRQKQTARPRALWAAARGVWDYWRGRTGPIASAQDQVA
jgi:hypothetical protein